VSAFQVHISDHDILTPGDAPSVLVAMNPAALKSNGHFVPPGGTLIVNVDAFDERSLDKAGYTTNPSSTAAWPPTRSTSADDLAHPGGGQAGRGQAPEAERSKNFFASVC